VAEAAVSRAEDLAAVAGERFEMSSFLCALCGIARDLCG